MMKSGTWILLALVLSVGFACDASNPVAPDEPLAPGGAGGSSGTAEYTISFTDGTGGSVVASETVKFVITVTVQDSGGSAAPNNTQIAFTASLGNFGRDGSNNEIKEVTLALIDGTATIEWTPGTEIGVAQILAAVGNAVARRNIVVEAPPELPIADFEFEVSGLIVLFTDASTGGNPTSWSWDFDDGSCPGLAECTEREPKHTYSVAGTYAVRLTASNEAGPTTKRKLVVVGEPPETPVSSFEFTPGAELQVIFTDTSTGPPTRWKWDFGDGCAAGDDEGEGGEGEGGFYASAGFGSSDDGACVCPECTEQNPTHDFPSKGQYLVSLEVGNTSGTNKSSAFVDVGAAIPELKASFDFEISESGLIVTFTDTSTGAPTDWSWNFGDSTCPAAKECSQQNPIHEYTEFGEYQVTLTVTDAGGAESTANKLVAAGAPKPVANFDWTPKNQIGLRILFEDLSENEPTRWEWDFGDGTCPAAPECVDENPAHDYEFSGSYPVKLTVFNTGGEDDTTKLVDVDSGEEFPEAKFTFTKLGGLTVEFEDLSTGGNLEYLWDFGDPDSEADNSSTNPNPIHIFTEADDYTVELTVTNGEGSNSTSLIVRFSVPKADFSFSQSGTTATFTDESSGGPTGWEWTFDGCTDPPAEAACPATKTGQGPVTFDFGEAGTYSVTLEVTNDDGLTDEVTKSVTILP